MSDQAIRVGDRFLVEVEVDVPLSGALELASISIDGESKGWVKRSFLLASKRLPRPIKVGDRVIHQQINAPAATVIGIHKARAWVAFDNDTDGHYPLSDLTLADGETQ